MTSTRMTALALSAIIVLAACGGSDAPSSDTAPATTERPTTQPSATEPPTTQPPATEPPATEPPVTEPTPATDPASSSADDTVDIAYVAPSAFDPNVDAPICLEDLSDGDQAVYVERSCDEPHDAEVVALVLPDFDVMPEDATEASIALRRLCGPLVSAATGQALTEPGIGVGFDSPNGLGDDVVEPVSCLASVTVPALVGSFRDLSIDEVLGEVEILAQLEPGTCFEFVGDSFDLGVIVDCSVDGAIMAVGTYEMSDVDVYSDLDVWRAERTEKCTTVLEASGLDGDPATLSGTFPGERDYFGLGARIATCDVTPN